jgi:hypothetical protein
MMNFLREHKGKSLLIAGILFMWLLLFTLFQEVGYTETWKLWKVPARDPAFWDFRLIPGGVESFRNGYEPTVNNPYDPGQRPFNYPAFWRLFFYTNITQKDTNWIAPVMIALFFIAVILFPRDLSVAGALGMLIVLFSPAAMLLYERGNVDLIVFFICIMAILALDVSIYLSVGILLFGAVIKMFPFFGLTIFLREPKKKFLMILAVSVLFMLGYSLLTFQSQSAAWNSTARSGDRSYGTFVFVTHFATYFQSFFPNLFAFNQWRFLFEMVALAVILLLVVIAMFDGETLLASNERNLTAFRMGASIYVGTFMLGNIWDYRLAFLVLVVPQLIEWFRTQAKKHRIIAIASMIGVVLSCWYLLLKIDFPLIPLKDPLNRSFVVDEIINWLLLAEFTYLLLVSSPHWLRQLLQKVPSFFQREQVVVDPTA